MCQFDHLNTFNNFQENSVLAQGTLLYLTVKSVLISEVIRCVYKIIISNMRYIYLCVLLNKKKNFTHFFHGILHSPLVKNFRPRKFKSYLYVVLWPSVSGP